MTQTDALLETLRYAPRRVIAERLAEHAYRLEDELQQANDSYAALAALFEHFMKSVQPEGKPHGICTCIRDVARAEDVSQDEGRGA